MSRTLTALVALLLLAGVATAVGSIDATHGVGESTDETPASANTTTDGVRVHADETGGVDVSAGDENTLVSLSGIGGNGTQSGSISHGAIDEGVEAETGVAACATGLDGEDSPLAIDVDGEAGVVSVVFSTAPTDDVEGGGERINPREVVAECSGYGE